MKSRKYREQFASMMLTASITLALPASAFAEDAASATVPNETTTEISMNDSTSVTIPEVPATTISDSEGSSPAEEQTVLPDEDPEVISDYSFNMEKESSDLITTTEENNEENLIQDENGILTEKQFADDASLSSTVYISPDFSNAEQIEIDKMVTLPKYNNNYLYFYFTVLDDGLYYLDYPDLEGYTLYYTLCRSDKSPIMNQYNNAASFCNGYPVYLQADTRYYIVVTYWDVDEKIQENCTFTLKKDTSLNPSDPQYQPGDDLILVENANHKFVSAKYNDNVTLSVQVYYPEDKYTLLYQWYHSEGLISNSNSPELTTSACYVKDSGGIWKNESYWCVVTATKKDNPKEQITAKSEDIEVHVKGPNFIQITCDAPDDNPSDDIVIVPADTPVKLTAEPISPVDNNTQITYQWISDLDRSITGKDKQVVTVIPSPSENTDSTYYTCYATFWSGDKVVDVAQSSITIASYSLYETINTARSLQMREDYADAQTRVDTGYLDFYVPAKKQAYVSFTPLISGNYRIAIHDSSANKPVSGEVLGFSGIQIGTFCFSQDYGHSTVSELALDEGKTYYIHFMNPDDTLTLNELEVEYFGKASSHTHIYGDWTIITPATYTSEGLEVHTCGVGGEKETHIIPKLPHSHSYGNWTITTNATAFAEGKQSRICSICGAVESQSIPKLAPFLNLNVSGTLPMKTKQKSKVVKVTGLQSGDYVVSWTSSKNSIVKIYGSGNTVTLKAGKKKGSAKITVVTAAGSSRAFIVKVQTGAVKTKKLIVSTARKLTLKKGQKVSIGAIASPLTTQQKLIYSSSSKKVATVSKGVIHAKKKGKATITVKSGSKKVTIKVSVK